MRSEDLPIRFGTEFRKDVCRLRSGGEFEFDAVSSDRSIICVISTSRLKTSGDKLGIGKIAKVYKDFYFLLLAEAGRRIAIFTEECMCRYFESETTKGRVPRDIEVVWTPLPDDLSWLVSQSREIASLEVRSIR